MNGIPAIQALLQKLNANNPGDYFFQWQWNRDISEEDTTDTGTWR